jgi:hypothetical protein
MTTQAADLGDGDLAAGSTRRRFAPLETLAALVARIRTSEYLVVGGSRRFRAVQRRRTRSASRIGYAVIVGAVAFDSVALLELQTGHPEVALVLSLITGAMAAGAWVLVPGILRRHAEPVAWAVMMGLAISTVATGLAVPALAVQTAGYLLVIPGLVALMLPWRTVMHIRWLLAYAVVAAGY